MADPLLVTLEKLVGAFEALDREALDVKRPDWGDHLVRTVAAKNLVKDFLAQHSGLRTSGALADKLRRIRSNQGYNIDRAIVVAESLTGERVSQELEDVDWMDALFKEGTASYVDHTYFKRRRQVANIVTSHTLPASVLAHLARIRECFALGLYPATVVFCRAVIEAALFEFVRRKGLLQTNSRVVNYADYRPAEIRSRARPHLPRGTFETACGEKGIVRLADRVLHSKDAPVELGERDALKAVRATFALIEDVFA